MRVKTPPTLYHFTCEHGRAGIEKSGILRTNPSGFLPALGPLLWLTDLAAPTVDSVGLTSEVYLTCDRLAYRYRVQTKAAIPWSAVRERCAPDILAILERYSEPDHWWVTRRLLTSSEFTYDPAWEQEREQNRLQVQQVQEAHHGSNA